VEAAMTAVVPQYRRGVALDPDQRERALDLMARLVDLYTGHTTDRAPSQLREPVANYLDRDRWQREMTDVFHRIPIPVGVSVELPNPGDYKTLRVAGRSIVIARGRGGELNAMINVCRHRGMQVVPDGCGSARRFSCIYHAWTYGLDGQLLGVHAEDTFGPVDKDEFSLLRLATAERAGIMFAGLTPGLTFDIDDWLGDVTPELDALGLAAAVPFSTRYLDGPNWKVTADGFLESYHFASLHPDTVALTNFTNLAAFDSYGPHIRNTFGLKPLAQAADLPREEWDPISCLGVIYWLFPGLAVAGGWREHTAVSIMLPGSDWASSITQQTLLLRQPPRDDAEQAAAQASSDFFYGAFKDEDYTAQFAVQQGLASVANESHLFGRNEPAVQHFHRTLDELMAPAVP
jgi:nitrite reductase/ring-hydroxylating ferredoxin subunit